MQGQDWCNVMVGGTFTEDRSIAQDPLTVTNPATGRKPAPARRTLGFDLWPPAQNRMASDGNYGVGGNRHRGDSEPG